MEEIKAEGSKSEATPKKWFKCDCECGKKKHIIAAIIILVVILVGAGAYYYKFKKNDIGAEGAKAKIENLIKDGGGSATVKSVEKDGDLYKVTVNANGQDQPVYVTKDGTKFIQNLITFDEIAKQNEASKQAAEPKDIPKSDHPAVDLYVMGFCPYGNKAEDTVKPVYDLLKNKVDFNFHYIVTISGNDVQSLHGPSEVAEDEREACVLKNYGKDKWMSFVVYVNDNCGSDGACWETGAKKLTINTSTINACVNSEGLTLMQASEKASGDAGAQGSPTMTINGVATQAVYQYGNSESYKQAICSAFNTAPAECSKTLSTATSTTQGGSCGN